MNQKLLVHYLKYIILPGILFFLIILFVISVYFELQLEQSGSTSVVNTTTMETISNSGVLIISDYDWKVNGVSVKSDKYIPGDCSPSRSVESRIDMFSILFLSKLYSSANLFAFFKSNILFYTLKY